MNINKVIIVGHLTRSPELRYVPQTGTAVATFDVATNRAWTDPHGEKREEVEFHHVVTFGQQAEPAAEYLRTGQLVAVEGRLRTRSWESEGKKHYRTEIVAERIQFGPKKLGSEAPLPPPDETETAPVEVAPGIDPDEDIPF